MHPRQRRARQWLARRGGSGRPRVTRSGCLGLQGSLVRHRRWQRWSNRGDGLRTRSGTALGRCCCLCWRLDGPGLAGLVGNGDRVGHVIHHDRIVHVVVDDIVRRWRGHVSRRLHPYRDRSVDRHRQHEDSDRRRGRRQYDEFRRRRCQKNDWRGRWRRKAKIGIVKDQNRPADVDDLVRRRGRNVVVHERKSRRRLKCRTEVPKAPAGIPGV